MSGCTGKLASSDGSTLIRPNSSSVGYCKDVAV
jgi:hypothetical protein